MTLSERDQLYVEHMLECIERVERFVGKQNWGLSQIYRFTLFPFRYF